MTDPTSRDLDALSDAAEDLDGHTVEELADYVDRGCTPPDPTIEGSPGCRRAIAALERLRAASAAFLVDAEVEAPSDAWSAGVMRSIAADSRAGADLLLERTAQGDEIVITEGALREIVRGAGDDEPGLLVGRVRLDGGSEPPDARLIVGVDVIVAYGVRVPDAAARLRAAVATGVERHTGFRHVRVDVVVRDVIVPRRPS